MPFAPQIRKYILRALEEAIIPALQDQSVPQVLAAPPWDFTHVEHWTLRKKLLPDRKAEPTQMIWAWKKEHLVAGRMPFIGFVYEGVSDDKVGVTTKMAKAAKAKVLLPGVTTLRLSAPAVICFPPGVPRRDGSAPYCEKSRPGFASSRTLWLNVSTDETLVHYCESDVDEIFHSHSLQIKDQMLTQLAHTYVDELYYEQKEGDESTHGLLLSMMKRLRRYLAHSAASLSNSARPTYQLKPSFSHNGVRQSKSEQLCKITIEYIDTHLQAPLTWELLAGEMGVSPAYLNYVFRKTTGMSVMRYVQMMRMEAAKLMLGNGLERINDIARLVGFASLSSFSASFKRHVGCSPSDYVHETARKSPKSTFSDRLRQQ